MVFFDLRTRNIHFRFLIEGTLLKSKIVNPCSIFKIIFIETKVAAMKLQGFNQI